MKILKQILEVKQYSFLIVWLFVSVVQAQIKDTIQGAWYPWVPYQYINDQGTITGLDYALITHVFQKAEVKVNFDLKEEKTWEENQKDVLDGKKIVTGGAFWTEDRHEKYLISEPYRYEWNTLYILKDDRELSKISNIDALLHYVKKKKLKLGVVLGYRYTSPVVNNFVDTYGDKNEFIIKSINEEENFDQLINNKVNIIIADRITGAQIIWENREKWKIDVSEHILQLPKKPIHLLLHKGKDSLSIQRNKALMSRFNTSLKTSKKNGELNNLIANYLFPVLMNITVQTKWFQLIDYIGAVFFAITGFLLARESRFDIFGTIIMVALLTSGGGIMRDLLVSKTPSFLADTTYLYIILSVSLIGFLLLALHIFLIRKYRSYYLFINRYGMQSLFLKMFIEAIALGAYTIVGVGVAVEMNLKPLWLWGPCLGVLTSCGGGILASCLKNNKAVNSLKGGMDPEVSILGGIGFSLFLLWQINRLNPQEVFLGVLVTIIVMALVLYILFLLKVKSPVLKLDEDINPRK
ncbi:TRIC cation channel family protein [Flavivirga jejuensis]|uniref:TRIC cation channel family protein n=1 Tax=Flavivirga jejuensis TaxID=870487 RepID=A0ABT8WP47_9FLAO|nr:transporter substrate-binding domain-containing protein [Flavivirga jejuensis]MDO5974932.1 TRIC cation channel family protein [Flavivirga jejuensis]